MYHAVEAIALQVWPGRLAQVTVLRAVVTNLMSGDGGRYNRAIRKAKAAVYNDGKRVVAICEKASVQWIRRRLDALSALLVIHLPR